MLRNYYATALNGSRFEFQTPFNRTIIATFTVHFPFPFCPHNTRDDVGY